MQDSSSGNPGGEATNHSFLVANDKNGLFESLPRSWEEEEVVEAENAVLVALG